MPSTGTGAISTGGGGGVAHDFSAFGTVRFANGFGTFANGDVAFGSFEPSNSGMERAFEGMPALRRAIFVVSLANILGGEMDEGRKEGREGGGKRGLPFELGWWLNSSRSRCLKQRGCRGKREAGISGSPCFQGFVTWLS